MMSRYRALLLAACLPFLGACAVDRCNALVYEPDEIPERAPQLIIPEGVVAPPETGAYRIPPARAAAPDTCLARPPQTVAVPENVEDEESLEEE